MTKKQKKIVKVIVLTLAVIGVITVVDNGYRLGKELVNTVKNHRWNTVVIGG